MANIYDVDYLENEAIIAELKRQNKAMRLQLRYVSDCLMGIDTSLAMQCETVANDSNFD